MDALDANEDLAGLPEAARAFARGDVDLLPSALDAAAVDALVAALVARGDAARLSRLAEALPQARRVGFDVEPRALALARQNDPRASFVELDLLTRDPPDLRGHLGAAHRAHGGGPCAPGAHAAPVHHLLTVAGAATPPCSLIRARLCVAAPSTVRVLLRMLGRVASCFPTASLGPGNFELTHPVLIFSADSEGNIQGSRRFIYGPLPGTRPFGKF